MSNAAGGSQSGPTGSQPVIAPLAERDLAEAADIARVAFGTFLGVPDVETFWRDRDYVHGRWGAPHVAAFSAIADQRLIGTNFATRWGSVGFFGPLSVRPESQARGVAKALVAATVNQFEAWGTTHEGLFTFANSAKHVALYQKFGFYPRFLTAIMTAPAQRTAAVPGASCFSGLSEAGKTHALLASREVTNALYPGLDLSDEIAAVNAQGLGDTVLLEGASGLTGFAICHHGPRSEAGANVCLVKFGAVRPAPSADEDFARMVNACEVLAVSAGKPILQAGANMARQEAYRHLINRGFRTMMQGVAMHRRNEPGYCRPGVYIIDDWR